MVDNGPVEILAFGPHPDDIEIGIGGTLVKHATSGLSIGLCDLTAGEMGSNGTVEERLAEAQAARAVLGAQWRVNLRLPDRALVDDHLVQPNTSSALSGLSCAARASMRAATNAPVTLTALPPRANRWCG